MGRSVTGGRAIAFRVLGLLAVAGHAWFWGLMAAGVIFRPG